MSIEENKEVVRRVYDHLNRRELAALFKLFNPGHVGHFTDRDMSLEEEKQFWPMFFAAFPDANWTIEDMVAEGDRVAYRVTCRGTHRGEFMGIAPTGNKIETTNTGIERIAGGKLAEWWGTTDTLRMMQQLGVIPKQ